MNNITFNGVYSFVMLFGFIYILIDLTITMSKGRKARGLLGDIEKLVKKAGKTKDEKVKEQIKKEIFEILEKKL